MTDLTPAIPAGWSNEPAGGIDHLEIADFVAVTPGLGGRKFAADSRDIAEALSGAFPDQARVLRDERGAVRGYGVLHQPHGEQREEVLAEFAYDLEVPRSVVAAAVDELVRAFHRVAPDVDDDAYLRVYIGRTQDAAIDALVGSGAYEERRFIRTRKPLDDEDQALLAASGIPGLRVLRWPDVIDRGIGELVRRVQADTFREHFGNMAKTPEVWEHHLASRAFSPDFSFAVIAEDAVSAPEVVGYVLGSVYTDGTTGTVEQSVHTDYIGVARSWRRRGIAEVLLNKVWLAALQRGFTLASLFTDIENASGAHHLYARLGYVAVEHHASYRIDRRPVRAAAVGSGAAQVRVGGE